MGDPFPFRPERRCQSRVAMSAEEPSISKTVVDGSAFVDRLDRRDSNGVSHGTPVKHPMRSAGEVMLKPAPYTDLQSQRDCVVKPRVARNELPWGKEGQ
jgi:hypothetical protein